jgi:transcriptional regulator GlxA family with amidase domain
VARRCGFSCAAALRPHFRRFTGATPAAYRSTFSGPEAMS